MSHFRGRHVIIITIIVTVLLGLGVQEILAREWGARLWSLPRFISEPYWRRSLQQYRFPTAVNTGIYSINQLIGIRICHIIKTVALLIIIAVMMLELLFIWYLTHFVWVCHFTLSAVHQVTTVRFLSVLIAVCYWYLYRVSFFSVLFVDNICETSCIFMSYVCDISMSVVALCEPKNNK